MSVAYAFNTMVDSDTRAYALEVATAYERLKRSGKITAQEAIDASGMSPSTFYRCLNNPDTTSRKSIDQLAAVLKKLGADIAVSFSVAAVSDSHREWCELGAQFLAEFPEHGEKMLEYVREIFEARRSIKKKLDQLGNL